MSAIGEATPPPETVPEVKHVGEGHYVLDQVGACHNLSISECPCAMIMIISLAGNRMTSG